MAKMQKQSNGLVTLFYQIKMFKKLSRIFVLTFWFNANNLPNKYMTAIDTDANTSFVILLLHYE